MEWKTSSASLSDSGMCLIICDRRYRLLGSCCCNNAERTTPECVSHTQRPLSERQMRWHTRVRATCGARTDSRRILDTAIHRGVVLPMTESSLMELICKSSETVHPLHRGCLYTTINGDWLTAEGLLVTLLPVSTSSQLLLLFTFNVGD